MPLRNRHPIKCYVRAGKDCQNTEVGSTTGRVATNTGAIAKDVQQMAIVVLHEWQSVLAIVRRGQGISATGRQKNIVVGIVRAAGRNGRLQRRHIAGADVKVGG